MRFRKTRCSECGAYNRSNRKTCRCCGKTLPNRRVYIIGIGLCLCFISIVVYSYFVPRITLNDLMEANPIFKTELLPEQIEFGMSKEDLIQSEDVLYFYENKNNTEIIYCVNFRDIPGKIACWFDQNRGLICLTYYFTDYRQDDKTLEDNYNRFMTDYYFIESYLTNKYGHQEIQYKWNDNSYEYHEPYLPEVISNGELAICTYRYSEDGYYIEHYGHDFLGHSFRHTVILHTGTYNYQL